MPKFKIPIEWKCYGEIKIEAKNLDEAIEEVQLNSDETVLPKDWDLEEGSIDINYELVEELNPGHKINIEEHATRIFEEEQEMCSPEEREARRHLEGIGEGYGEETEKEMDEES